MKITILDGNALNPGDMSWEKISALGELAVFSRTPPELVVERSKDSEVLFINKVLLPKNVLSELPKLKYVGLFSTGVNVVDLDETRKLGITVTNIPSYSTESVAQLTFAHLLNLTFQLSTHTFGVRNGDWSRSIDFSYWKSPLIELAGLKFGSIGFGNIGKRVCEIAKTFGMQTFASSRSIHRGVDYCGTIGETVENLLQQCDVVSLHCPLTPETDRMMNAAAFGRMKSSAFFINTSRGGLVDEEALASALNESRLAGAGLDVLSQEPPNPNNPLLTAKNCHITPHFAWGTHAARKRLLDIAANNLQAFLNGTPENVVNLR
ncbi:MAG: D-2-hydroxyacid dehydrogenase [Thermoguttaceae bacterium]